MTTREGILGRGLFDVFPDNLTHPSATGVQNLRTSLQRVLQDGCRTQWPYRNTIFGGPIPRAVSSSTLLESCDSPVFGPDKKIAYAIHRAEDVSEFVRLKKREVEREADGGPAHARRSHGGRGLPASQPGAGFQPAPRSGEP